MVNRAGHNAAVSAGSPSEYAHALPLLDHWSSAPLGEGSLRIIWCERLHRRVLMVQGELDLATSPRLDDALVLIRHAHAEDARVSLTKGSPQIQRLFELSGASEHLPFVVSE